MQPLQGCFSGTRGSKGRKDTGLNPLKPQRKQRQRAQRPAAARSGSEQAASCKQSRRSERSSRRSSQRQRVAAVRQLQGAITEAAVRCKNRVATHRNKKAGIVSRQPARGRASGITSRARATLGITAARAPPHAGRWESLDTHAGTSASVSRITAMCRVRNNRNNLSIFRPPDDHF